MDAPREISPVDYLLRGVAVPAGHDRIVFTYDPASFRIGWIVSLGRHLSWPPCWWSSFSSGGLEWVATLV